MTISRQTIPSNNYDTSRKTIDRIVIHWIVGNLASADATFKNPSRGASAHYGVEDSKVIQWVDEKHTAYHCGNYTYNQRSVGIEHSAAPDRPASEATYQTSGQLIREIAKRYSIPLDRAHIVGHKEVSSTQCPGTMNIDKLISIAKQTSPSNPTTPSSSNDREERNKNWNWLNQVVTATGILLDGNNPQKSVDEAIAQIKKVQKEADDNRKDRDKWFIELQTAKERIKTLESKNDRTYLEDMNKIKDIIIKAGL